MTTENCTLSKKNNHAKTHCNRNTVIGELLGWGEEGGGGGCGGGIKSGFIGAGRRH